MLASSKLLTAKWPTLKARNATSAAPLTYAECASLEKFLAQDGTSIAYSAMISMGDALRGIEAGYYSWATVKLYYTVFYGLHALLAFNKFALFYVGTSPFLVLARPGERPHHGATPSSHKVIMNTFKREFRNSWLLSQSIGQEEPLQWLQSQRERVNYKQPKFSEPGIPEIFSHMAKSKGIRKLISAYFADKMYAFDPDHAILAYPISVLKEMKAGSGTPNLFSEADQDALHKLLSDSLGPITAFDEIISPQ